LIGEFDVIGNSCLYKGIQRAIFNTYRCGSRSLYLQDVAFARHHLIQHGIHKETQQ
jgi:hypothetical protein